MKIFINLMSILFFLNHCCAKKAELEKYIIPNKYIGIIVLVCDYSEGQSKKYEGMYRIYNIDTLGVLLTKFDCNHGVFDDTRKEMTFYYSNGKQIPYRFFLNKKPSEKVKDPPHNEIQVYSFIYGTVGKTQFKSFIIDTFDNQYKYLDHNKNEQMEYVSKVIKSFPVR